MRIRGSNSNSGGDDIEVDVQTRVLSKGRFVKSEVVNQSVPCMKTIRREIMEFKKVTILMIRGQGSYLAYLFIPSLISIFWILVCIFATGGPDIYIGQKISSPKIRDHFNMSIYEKGQLDKLEIKEKVHIQDGESVNIVIAIPFLDVNPVSASDYIRTLEWILVYSSVPVNFHIITNKDSISYVNTVIEKLNKSRYGDFETNILTFAEIIERMTTQICPTLQISDEFCDVLMGSFTPLILPFLLPELKHAIYMSREMVFQDDIGYLQNILENMIAGKQAIGMSPEQSKTYMEAFSSWQELNPNTKLGRPPPNGKPGYNPDLILLDMQKLRSSTKFKSYLNEKKLNEIMKKYLYKISGDGLNLGDMINLIAADSNDLIWNLGCEWNRLAKKSTDLIDKKFDVCDEERRVRVWNGNPYLSSKAEEKDHSLLI